MHLKNYSIITGKDGIHRLSPAYDLLNTTIALRSAEEESALDRDQLSLGRSKACVHGAAHPTVTRPRARVTAPDRAAIRSSATNAPPESLRKPGVLIVVGREF
jgi:hypothetical protein